MRVGPEELPVTGKIGVAADDDGGDIADPIDDVEARVRAALPAARVIYLEPHVYRTQPTQR